LFFFEKKNQKTFTNLSLDLSGKAEAKNIRSFLLLFFKKEGLPFVNQGLSQWQGRHNAALVPQRVDAARQI
jgi:hypothetical protein